jgi:membrane protein YdbS with pleckstrin-like domain
MDDPFAPPAGQEWIRVSPRLARMRRWLLVIGAGVPLVVLTVVVAVVTSAVGAAVCGVVTLAVLVGGWLAIGRNLRSWGYAERADDLLVTHGALFRSLTVVPYGRMQLVDVAAGPIERSFGLVNVRLHTAAATTDAKVCGLTPADAGALRDRLTALGEAHAAGL